MAEDAASFLGGALCHLWAWQAVSTGRSCTGHTACGPQSLAVKSHCCNHRMSGVSHTLSSGSAPRTRLAELSALQPRSTLSLHRHVRASLSISWTVLHQLQVTGSACDAQTPASCAAEPGRAASQCTEASLSCKSRPAPCRQAAATWPALLRCYLSVRMSSFTLQSS